MIDRNAVWLIAGCSTGLGRALVLEPGCRVVANARGPSAVGDIVEDYADVAFAVELDVDKLDQVKVAVEAARDRFGEVDVLVNNAGYGYAGESPGHSKRSSSHLASALRQPIAPTP